MLTDALNVFTYTIWINLTDIYRKINARFITSTVENDSHFLDSIIPGNEIWVNLQNGSLKPKKTYVFKRPT